MSDEKKLVSAIVPVSERLDDARSLYVEYKEALTKAAVPHEFIFVLDGSYPETLLALQELRSAGEPIKVIVLAQSFGEATALTAGFEQAAGEIILTLPAYYQVNPQEIPKILAGIGDNDMVIGRRWPRVDPWLKRIQTRAFHSILNFIAECSFKDLGCGMRAMKRNVVDEIALYGDQHRFLPVLAEKRGFRVQEVNVSQSQRDLAPNVYRSGVYLRRILDILTVFFLVKFTKKPLRFFGLIGSSLFAVGGVILLYLIFQRLFWDIALADRPALLLSTLLVVLGAQLFALGLIGELIIFTHARELKEYTIDEIVE